MAAERKGALRLEHVSRSFAQGAARLEVIKDASLTLPRGEMVALVGPSGSGKSTLLHIAGLLERPDGGEIWILDNPSSRLSDARRTELRRTAIGFVYQYHHLLPEFSALENVVLPQMIAGRSRRAAAERARELLGLVGLSQRLRHRPAQLSGGEQQRVAIARALANAPALLLADEPTGNLDQHTADDVFALLGKLVHEMQVGALIATHNLNLAQRMDRTITLRDGVIVQL
ncbi:ABC transporter ATP-binding protein [Rhodospirillaceae bacterium SYSU D60014]|uniref:ABC transporter ATP-binding protein n=1 Tax=Virgifigura deserti TaxID=2268457 RepID=UPI000E666A25